MRQRGPSSRDIPLRLMWLLVLPGALALFAAGTAGTEPPITCGMVALSDVQLMEDLACTGTAILVGADAIEIDLNGHTLTVNGGDAVFNGGYHYVTVMDGSVQGGRIAITGGASYNTVSALHMSGAGITLEQSDKAFIYRNTFVDGGVYAENTARRHLIMSNSFDHAAIVLDGFDITIRLNTLDYGSIVNIEGGRIAVIDNRVKHGGIAMHNSESGDVIVMDNKVTDSPADGIAVGASRATAAAPARIVRNDVSRSAGRGIVIEGADGTNAVMANNYASHNGALGIEAPLVADLGLNRAKYNGGPQQCVGVACAGRKAQPVTCGMVATTDVSLMEDLSCSGTAITVGADGIEIDLKGHVLTQTGGMAIVNNGYDYVTVRYGTLAGGDVILDDDVQYPMLSSLNLIDADMWLYHSHQGFYFRNSVRDGGILLAEPSTDNLVMSNTLAFASVSLDGTRNTVRDSSFESGQGIHNSEGHAIEAIGNRLNNTGIGMEDTQLGTLVMGNKVTGSPRYGIHAFCDGEIRVVRNQVSYSGDDGISLRENCDATNATLVANYASHNAGLGINAPGYPMDGGRNRAKDNANALECVGVTCH